jgi:Ca2+-binding EF-hand superfamily protein
VIPQAPKRKAATFAKAAPKPKLSKLAKENNITNEQEKEIREAFELFSVDDVEGFEDEKTGVLRTGDVRRCLM